MMTAMAVETATAAAAASLTTTMMMVVIKNEAMQCLRSLHVYNQILTA